MSRSPGPPDHGGVEGSSWLTIDVVATRTGMSVSRIRSIERRGLIQSTYDDSGRRLFNEHVLEDLLRIRRMTEDLGVNMAGVEVIYHMRRRLIQLQQELTALRRQLP